MSDIRSTANPPSPGSVLEKASTSAAQEARVVPSATTAPAAHAPGASLPAPQPAPSTWLRRFSPWVLAGSIVVITMLVGALIASSSRAWSVVVILGGAGIALLVLQLTRIERRSDKRLEYTVVMLVSALAIVNTMNSILWQGWIKDQPPTSASLYANHDLARLTGTVIQAVIEKSVDDARNNRLTIAKPDHDALLDIAGAMREEVGPDGPPLQWEQWMRETFANDASRWRGIEQDALVEYIRNPRKPALTAEEWKQFLAHAAKQQEQTLSAAGATDTAVRLRDHFGTVVRETLKHDYMAGGQASKAFAAMQLDIMRELMDDAPRLTLYHLRSAGEQKEITPEYEGVLQNDALRVQTANVDGKHWYILTIDGAGDVGLYAPGELISAEDGLWSWQPTAPPTETVLLLVAAHELSGEERGMVMQSIRSINGQPPALTAGQQIIWGEESGESSGWKVVEGGRGRPAPVARSGEQPWMTRVCEELRKINGLRFGGRTIAVTPGQSSS